MTNVPSELRYRGVGTHQGQSFDLVVTIPDGQSSGLQGFLATPPEGEAAALADLVI